MKKKRRKRQKIAKSKYKTRLKKFKEVCHKWLVIGNDEYIDVQFGAIFANRLDSKPVWLYIVGPPGSGKTEILQSFTGSKEIYSLSSLTANTLISGRCQSEKEKDPSLLPKLDGKVLIIKDFTVILKGNSDIRLALLRMLTSVYPKKISIQELARKLKMSPSTLRIHVNDLYSLGIVKLIDENRRSSAFSTWCLEEEYGELLETIWEA